METKDVLSQSVLTERDINLIKLRANKDKTVSSLDRNGWKEEYLITETQTKKGLEWLLNKWKTPRDIERKNNPFGYREADILGNFSHFTFTGLVNLANSYQAEYGIAFHVPCYRVYDKEGNSFEYHIEGGGVRIIG